MSAETNLQYALQTLLDSQKVFYEQVMKQSTGVLSSSGPPEGVLPDALGRSDNVVAAPSFESCPSPGLSEFSLAGSSVPDFNSPVITPASSQLPMSIPRNPHFFIEDHLCQFKAGDELFQVHSFVIESMSDRAEQLLRSRHKSPGNIIVLEDVRPFEFERYLRAVYCKISETPQLSSKEDWTAVLKVSCLFDFKSMRSLAIDRLYSITTPIDKIVLARDYGMNEWLHNAYVDVCTDSSLPTQEDSISLGFDTYRTIAEAREALRPFKPTTRGINLPSVIQRFFSLPHTGVTLEQVSEPTPEAAPARAPIPEEQLQAQSTTVAPELITPAAIQDAGADDWFGGVVAKKGKKGKKASPFAWEEPAPAPVPEPEPVLRVPHSAVPEIKEGDAISSVLNCVPRGFGGLSALSLATLQAPKGPSMSSAFATEASDSGHGKITKKAGDIFGSDGRGGGTTNLGEEPVVHAREPTPPPPPPPASERAFVPEPAPVVETKVEEPEDDWFNASTKAKKASVAPSVAAPAIFSTVVTAPFSPAAEEKNDADDWFASAKKRKDKRQDRAEEPAPAPAATPPPPVPEPVQEERKVEGIFAAEPAAAVTPAAEEEGDWFKSTAAPVKKVKKGAMAEESDVPSTDAEKKPEVPATAAADDWGLSTTTTKKKVKKGKK